MNATPTDAAAGGDSGAVAVSSETLTPSPEPVAWMHEGYTPHELRERASAQAAHLFVISDRVKRIWLGANPKHVEHYTIPLYAHPSPDVRDAERYRWLRERMYTNTFQLELSVNIPCHADPNYADVDRAIDTAIAKESRT